MTALAYPDAYLARHCTDERETRALAIVDGIGTFAAGWRDKLAVLQCYVIACLECQADAEDLFSTKLKTYRAEFDRQLAMARAATPDAAGSAVVFAIPLERG
jgi:hypothetical protein